MAEDLTKTLKRPLWMLGKRLTSDRLACLLAHMEKIF